MTITIRPAEMSDAQTILRFVRELAEYERAADAVKATGSVLAQALFGPKPAAEALIAQIDGEAVGFAVFFHNFSTWTGKRGLYLEDLYVTQEARKAGAGKALLRHLAAIAVERDCGRFEWSVLDWNRDAIDFYHAMGSQTLTGWQIERVEGDALKALAEQAQTVEPAG